MAKFEIYKDNAGEFRFRLKAGNGQNILASEGYAAKGGCTNGIESVKKNADNGDLTLLEQIIAESLQETAESIN